RTDQRRLQRVRQHGLRRPGRLVHLELRRRNAGRDSLDGHDDPRISRHARLVPGDRVHGAPHRHRRPGRARLRLPDRTRHRAACPRVGRMRASMKATWPLVAAALVASALPAYAAEKEKKKRPGRFRVGPLYLTPKLQLKNAGVDTNVFNQRTDEIADTSAVLSPATLIAWPIGRRIRLTGETHVDLNYF